MFDLSNQTVAKFFFFFDIIYLLQGDDVSIKGIVVESAFVMDYSSEFTAYEVR